LKDSPFQPAQLANAPDGTLYIVGVMREPPTARKTNSPAGSLAGRIIRVAPANFKQPAQVPLGNATTAQLVGLLRNPNGWQRDTAARLLCQRQDKAAILPLAQLALETQASPISRLHAFYTLASMRALAAAHLARALTDADERVREHAVLLSERFIGPGGNLPDILSGPLLGLAGDLSPRVRCQVAFTLGQFKHPARNRALADCLRRDPGNRWIQTAVMSSAGGGSGEILAVLAADGNVRANEGTRELMRQLVMTIGAQNQPPESAAALNAIQSIPEDELAFSLALALSDSLQRVNSSLVSLDVEGALRPLYERAIQAAENPGGPENLQMLAIRLLQTSRFADVQVAVNLMQRWPTLSPLMRLDAIVAMLARAERAAILLAGLERGVIPSAEITSVQMRFLLSHRDPIIRARALAVFGARAMAQRQPVVNRYYPALRMGGVAERGHGIYETRCALCHQSGGDGNPIGMSLANSARLSREQMFIKILDPNRNLPRNSAQAILETKDGATLMGFVTEQNEKSITLCQPNGAGRVVGRQNIVSQDTLGISAMPEGLEAGLSAQDLADLIEYLKPAGSAAR
jgi:putative heme-binding domain-containing protein